MNYYYIAIIENIALGEITVKKKPAVWEDRDFFAYKNENGFYIVVSKKSGLMDIRPYHDIAEIEKTMKNREELLKSTEKNMVDRLEDFKQAIMEEEKK